MRWSLRPNRPSATILHLASRPNDVRDVPAACVVCNVGHHVAYSVQMFSDIPLLSLPTAQEDECILTATSLRSKGAHAMLSNHTLVHPGYSEVLFDFSASRNFCCFVVFRLFPFLNVLEIVASLFCALRIQYYGMALHCAPVSCIALPTRPLSQL